MRIAIPLFALLGLIAACSTGEPSKRAASQCSSEPLPDGALARLESPRASCDDGRGSGAFGTWTTDERGLPAYEYTLAHWSDPLALYTNSAKDERRTHWSGLGNNRTTGFAYNHGGVELLATERGIISLNNVRPEQGRWGGGIGVVVDGDHAWSTLAAAGDAVSRRLFTLDGMQIDAASGDLAITHRVWAPAGDAAVLNAEAVVSNDSPYSKTFVYLETWDLNIEQRFFGLVSAGLTKDRSKFNSNFRVRAAWEPAQSAVVARYGSLKTPLDEATERIYVHPEVFLADPDAEAEVGYVSRDTVGFDELARARVDLDNPVSELALDSAEEAPTALTLQWTVTLQPGESRTLRSVFGYRYDDHPPIAKTVQAAAQASWETNGHTVAGAGVYIAADDEPWIAREFAWHAAMLRVNSMYDRYHGAHVFNQGSTYGYQQGINGAPRDIVLATLPTIYFDPALAKENLRYIMRTTDKTGRIYYAAIGYGVLTGVAIHEDPSDLDLFFLWGLSEYLLATRDFAFLQEVIPYYGEPDTQQTVLDHARKAFAHLRDHVGFGTHGLIRLHEGDWSDGIILRASDGKAAKEFGESVLNSAMAIHILPRFAAAVTAADAALATAAQVTAATQKLALEDAWTGRWYLRGYGDVDEPIGGPDQFFLEPQIFALLAGQMAPDRQSALLAAIAEILEDPSPIGQLVVYPPDEGNAFLEPGWDVNGGTWHAMNGILTAAYAGVDGKRAWNSLVKNSMMNHAEQYPYLWYGIWSGPDSYNAHYAERPGETFSHFATPMVDFPVNNSNQHALPIFGALRGYGVAATETGLAIRPAFTEKPFVLRTPWIKVAGGPENLAVEVMALHTGPRWISIAVPPQSKGQAVIWNGTLLASTREEGELRYLWAPARAGERFLVEVE